MTARTLSPLASARTALAGCLLALSAVAPAGAVPLRPANEDVARIPVRVVAGKLVVACDVSTRHRRIPANLFVDLSNPCGLALHNRAAFPLRAESADGTPTPITLHFPDFQVTVPKREHGPEEEYEEFTKYHSPELGENSLVGTIGAGVLADYHVTLDLPAGVLELSEPRARTSTPPPEEAGTLVLPITLENEIVWLPTRLPTGEPTVLGISTGRYDTVLDELLCEELGAPAGDIGALSIGGLDLAPYVAFRPAQVVQVHTDSVAGMLGLNLLEHLRIEFDRVNRYARVTPVVPPSFPAADLAFFEAMVEETPEPLEAFLEAHAGSRLALEAAELLLDLYLDGGGSAEQCQLALDAIEAEHPEDLRTTAMRDLMEVLAEAGRPDLELAAGEIGLAGGRVDRYPNAVHEVHARMGEVLFDRGDLKESYRHLLSAAFGLPEDGLVNLNLGRLYEAQGRAKRAFSRYVQAVIRPESGPRALEALARVQGELDPDEPFSIALLEKLVAGKVNNFGAATRFEPDETNSAGRTVLVEFFTNGDLGNPTRGGAVGGALGGEGLLSHFEPAQVAMLSYHLPDPRLEPLCNGLAETIAAERGVPGPYAFVVDGLDMCNGAGKPRDAEELYKGARGLVYERLLEETDYNLDLEARLEGDRLEGVVTVTGPADTSLDLRLVLAERGVLYPGESGVVVHKMVARASLTDDPSGAMYQPSDGGMSLSFSAALSDLDAANERWLDEFVAAGEGDCVRVSTRIDPRELTLVAYLRRRGTGEVLQAIQLDPERDEERPQ